MDIASENYTHFQTFSSKVEDWILVLINNNRLSKTANNFFYLQNICDNSNTPLKKIIITSHYMSLEALGQYDVCLFGNFGVFHLPHITRKTHRLKIDHLRS